jgi:type I restriction-modification system DNA methylase subunit
MNFPSIDIQGSIISAELLGKIRSEQAGNQLGKDFNTDLTNAKLKDEISFAWQDAKGQWTIFQNKLGRLKDGESGTTETRNFWIFPLLTNLGYSLTFNRQAEELNGKTFAISYRDSQLDGFPVYMGGFHESLDKRPENKQLRVSPHAMVQEYLNFSEHLYGLVTNGRQLRLLRDASRITRLSYVEFNLQKMMEEDLYSDFVILYRLLHASRMPKKIDGGAESIIEKYHQEGLEAGSAIRSKLGDAVKKSIKDLANGFINHPDNEVLREALQQGNLNPDEYYRQQLRIIYRLLFLFVIEERNLVYADSKNPETKRFGQIYFNYYSLLRLRKLAKKLPSPDAHRHYDLWQSLLSTFALFEKKEMGEKLGIMSLQGDLFGPDSIATSAYDLHNCRLSNALLLQIIKALTYFENQSNVQIAVNYGGLDVEEFGSVYEGLLELKLTIEAVAGSNQFSCAYAGSEERSKSGSHYTPDELVQPLIKHSLDYLLEDRKKIISDVIVRQRLTGPSFHSQREELVKQHIYSLKICDVACGSGHLLISGARRIAEIAAGMIEEEEQPNPKAFQLAKRNAILHCIYGVDKNPLAVELCKVALWLEAYVPGQPLNFLDHHIKCGDAIVGLAHRDELEKGIADEAFKTLPGDDKDVAKTLRDQNIRERKARITKATQLKAEFEKTTESSVQEAMVEYKTFNRLPETTPDEIDRKAKAYRRFVAGKGFTFLKAMADTQVAQFFIPKTTANQDSLMTDADFLQILAGYKGWQDRKVAKASVVALENRFFHWFLEFPEVFNEGGFHCVLGNPPFLGGQKLSGAFGDSFLESIKYQFSPIGAVDLVTYFFRRIFSILKQGGFQSLISTNTIAQGKAREDGLDLIVKYGGTINHAVKSMKWPGIAAVEVALVTVTKQKWNGKFILNGKEVNVITPYLDDSESNENPYPLKHNEGKCFQGSIVLGQGFVLEPEEAKALIEKNPKNKEVLFPYLNGEDLNNNPDQRPSRWVINFFDRTEEKAKEYSDCYNIVEKLVKPERQRWAKDVVGNPIIGEYILRKPLPEKWWIHGEKRPALYEKISNLDKVIVVALISKTAGFDIYSSNLIFSNKVEVFALSKHQEFSLLMSTLHNIWAWKYSTTMKSDLNYTPNTTFETFPFPLKIKINQEQKLEQIGKEYHLYRRQLMLSMQLGLTKTYNAFHAKEVQSGITTAALQAMDKKAIEKQYGKEVWNLWNHLQKTPGTCMIEEATAGIVKLRELHVEMDNAVLEAYGWQDVLLRHDFYEVDYLPENDRIRFTIHPDARKEILKRLLELNHQIHEEEVKAGLWDKKTIKSKEYKIADKEAMMVKEREKGWGDLFELT